MILVPPRQSHDLASKNADDDAGERNYWCWTLIFCLMGPYIWRGLGGLSSPLWLLISSQAQGRKQQQQRHRSPKLLVVAGHSQPLQWQAEVYTGPVRI